MREKAVTFYYTPCLKRSRPKFTFLPQRGLAMYMYKTVNWQ